MDGPVTHQKAAILQTLLNFELIRELVNGCFCTLLAIIQQPFPVCAQREVNGEECHNTAYNPPTTCACWV